MNRWRLVLLLAVIALVATFFAFDLQRLLTLDMLRTEYGTLRVWVGGHFIEAGVAYLAGYAALTAINLPVAAVLSLAGGALFGLAWGTLLTSFASSIGATLSFLLARFLFRDLVEKRFAGVLARVNEGLRRDGAYYLFALRLVPLFPYFVINNVMGLTRIRVGTFHWVGQLGMLPGTFVFTNAGTQLGLIATTSHILSPALIGSFALLGVFPLLAKWIVAAFSTRRALRRFTKPRNYDANLVVIGAGAAGLVSAYVAAAAKARVVLIEAERMGGDCLNTGCVPSKALIRSSRIAAYIRRAPQFGLTTGAPGVDFAAVMARVQRVIARIEPHDSIERYSELGVECITGHAMIRSPYAVEVNGRTIATRAIVIATGGRPAVPPIPGLVDIPHLTSDTVWQLSELPRRLLVLGGGAIGCELAQAFRRLGSDVTLVEVLPRLLSREDPEVGNAIATRFASEGIRVLAGWKALAASPGVVTIQRDHDTARVGFDQILVATGRRATTRGFGLEELGVALNPDGTVAVNEYLQTTYPNIYACGDAAGPYQLTHAGAHQAWFCATNALFGSLWKFRVSYAALPAAVFTDPEIARVGLNETEARDQGVRYEISRYGIDDLDRAIADGEDHGFVKALTVPGSDRILGVTIVGPQAGELISEFTLAMRHGLGLRKVLSTVHAYPTLAEANRYVGGAWQRAHMDPRLLRLAASFHRWRR